MNFEEYLSSKKIDAIAFQQAEPMMYREWETIFSQVHPNSFTVQKLNLINPIRRKYPAPVAVKATEKLQDEPKPGAPSLDQKPSAPATKPAVPRPVFKPKPKMN